jgi:general stress protein YciG
MADSSSTSSGVSKRGFASMDPQRKREIASKGGRAAHEKGTAHEFTPDEARNAGRKGGEAVSRNREHMASIGRRGGEAVSRDREHMANIGRKGGETVSRDRQHMANIGREGGESRNRDGSPRDGSNGKSEMSRMASAGAQPGQPEQHFSSPPNA